MRKGGSGGGGGSGNLLFYLPHLWAGTLLWGLATGGWGPCFAASAAPFVVVAFHALGGGKPPEK